MARIPANTQVPEHPMTEKKWRVARAFAPTAHSERRVKALRLLGLLFATGYSLLVTSQPGNYTTTDKGAIKRYESGRDCMGQRRWDSVRSVFKVQINTY